MRPVFRGEAPNTYAAYGDAIGDLEDRLGIYCTYCERRLPINLAVEHVSPKSADPARELDWHNFLLGCTNCNSVKSAKPTNDDDFLWPDRDNTLWAFEYAEGGFMTLDSELTGTVRQQADQLMQVVGLDRHKKRGWPRPARRDRRWEQREQVWRLAESWKERIAEFSETGRELAIALIADLALGYGFFSVWMTVFHDDPEVRLALIAGFTGTAQDCFDSNGNPVNRPGGRL